MSPTVVVCRCLGVLNVNEMGPFWCFAGTVLVPLGLFHFNICNTTNLSFLFFFFLVLLSTYDTSVILVVRMHEYLLCVLSFACVTVSFVLGAPFFASPYAYRSQIAHQNFCPLCLLNVWLLFFNNQNLPYFD